MRSTYYSFNLSIYIHRGNLLPHLKISLISLFPKLLAATSDLNLVLFRMMKLYKKTALILYEFGKAHYRAIINIQGQKLWEHDSEITGDPKAPLRGPTFWSSFEAPDP